MESLYCFAQTILSSIWLALNQLQTAKAHCQETQDLSVLTTGGFSTGKSSGFDFGLKTFLTVSGGSNIESPLFFKQGIN